MMALRRAFTLIELLVVIAIIAIIAAILFPVFARAKAAAKQTTCISNLKQIGSAIMLYMSDYDDVFPSAVDPVDKYRPEIWSSQPEFQARIPYMPLLHEALQTYIKSKDVFMCPSDAGTSVVDNFPDIEFETAPSMYKTYGTSYFFRTEIAFKYFQQSSFQLPASINVLFDAAGFWHGSTGRLTFNQIPPDLYRVYQGYRYNTLFGDMHVKSLTYDSLQNAWSTPL